MKQESSPASNKKILYSVYLLIFTFVVASLAIVVYFAILPALMSTKSTPGSTPARAYSAVEPSSPEAKETETKLNNIFAQMDKIYKPPKVNLEKLRVTENKKDDKVVVIKPMAVFPELSEAEDNIVKTEAVAIKMPVLQKMTTGLPNPVVYEITNIFSKPNLNGMLLAYGWSDKRPFLVSSEHFQSYDSFHLFANGFSMDVFNEPSVLTRQGTYRAITIACNGKPSNIEAIKNAIRDGHRLPTPLDCGQSLILHYGRPLTGSSVKVEFKNEPFPNVLEFSKVLGQSESSAIVLSDKDISDAKQKLQDSLYSEPSFSLFAAFLGYPALRKESFLVKGRIYTLLLATSEERLELEMSSYFRSLIEKLIGMNIASDEVSRKLNDNALVAIIYPTVQGDLKHFIRLKAVENTTSVEAETCPVAGAIILNPDSLRPLKHSWFSFTPSAYLSISAVENLFGEEMRGICFSIFEQSHSKPSQAYFQNYELWKKSSIKLENIKLKGGAKAFEYDVYIRPSYFQRPLISRVVDKILDILHKNSDEPLSMTMLEDRWYDIMLFETQYWTDLNLDILFYPKSPSSLRHLRAINY